MAADSAVANLAGSCDQVEAGVCPVSTFVNVMSDPRGTGKIGTPTGPSGPVAEGAIVRLLVGQAYGFIALRDGREVFFHRADLKDQTTFNVLQVGDVVAFELIDDRISGARAIHVVRSRSRA